MKKVLKVGDYCGISPVTLESPGVFGVSSIAGEQLKKERFLMMVNEKEYITVDEDGIVVDEDVA